MTRRDLQLQFPSASRAFLDRNADDPMAAVSNRDSEHGAGRALGEANKRPKSGKGSPSYRVTFISVRARELDDDNLIAGCKQLRDAVAAHLGLADDKKSIRFHYGQVVSAGEQGTIVMIEKI